MANANTGLVPVLQMAWWDTRVSKHMPRLTQSGSYPGVCLLALIIVMVGGHVVCQASSGLDYSLSNGLEAITT